LLKVGNSIIDMEMERKSYPENKFKNMLYIARIYDDNFKSGDNYDKLIKVIQVILNKENKNKRIVTKIQLKDEDNKVYNDFITIYEINLELARKRWYTCREQMTEAEKGFAFLAFDHRDDLEKIGEEDAFMKTMMNDIKKYPQFVGFLSGWDKAYDDAEWLRVSKKNERKRKLAEIKAKVKAEIEAEGIDKIKAKMKAEVRAEREAES
jgi:hypothetical protein